jgi:hypothetical protein
MFDDIGAIGAFEPPVKPSTSAITEINKCRTLSAALTPNRPRTLFPCRNPTIVTIPYITPKILKKDFAPETLPAHINAIIPESK